MQLIFRDSSFNDTDPGKIFLTNIDINSYTHYIDRSILRNYGMVIETSVIIAIPEEYHIIVGEFHIEVNAFIFETTDDCLAFTLAHGDKFPTTYELDF